MKSLLIGALARIAPHYLWRLRARKWSSQQTEEEELRLVPALCDTRKLSVDVGASMGLYTLHMLGYSSRCVTFEPRSLHAGELKKVFARSRPSVQVEQVALSDHAGVAHMRVVDSNLGLSTIESENPLSPEDNFHLEEVEIRTLDSYDLENVGFIKIDVEGHEEAVLRGALNTIRTSLPSVLVEMEERHKPGTKQRVQSLLGELNYKGYFLDGNRIRSIDVSTEADRRVNNFLFVQPNHIARLRSQQFVL